MQNISEFIERWETSGGSERANYALFLTELADVLGLEKPLPATDTGENDHYRFERPVASAVIGENSKKFIDLYRRGSFILETKQGAQAKVADPNQPELLETPKVRRVGHGVRGTRTWDKSMVKARGQADNYARGIAREDGWPPFIIVCDVGYVFEIYADFSGQGHGYTQYPDGNSYRVFLQDLSDPEIQQLLRDIWNDPLALDTSKRSAAVTREIADQLARLGRSFEQQGHEADKVASFLMRCLFSMFAEDVELLPKDSFTNLLLAAKDTPELAAPLLEELWDKMNTGKGVSTAIRAKVLQFNGGLFADNGALPLDSQQIALLIGAARQDWTAVEPAIFGTLLERALDKRQRHKLGAHYTPRAYVERLVMPTVIEPLRSDWQDVQASVLTLKDQGKEKDALKLVHAFHRRLCDTRVLDPACGSGNFLYVCLELMKRLEGEVTTLLEELGETQSALDLAGHTVDPHQFLGIELNPWAARVAEMVLWIGYLQWHFRTFGKATPAEPVLKDFHNIENRDAVLEWDDRTPRMDEYGNPVTRWDGTTTMRHPVTGEEVPDPNARVQVFDYAKPRAATWPEATFIVGNPPFIGNKRMRDALGDGYVEALWKAYPKMPQSADLVMFWWEKAAQFVRLYDRLKKKGARRVGLITTNSIAMTFNRRVLGSHMSDLKTPMSIILAIPDHPWVDAFRGAAVRIAMVVAVRGKQNGRLLELAFEQATEVGHEGREVGFKAKTGKILPSLRVGPDTDSLKPLASNQGMAWRGVTLVGTGFVVPEQRLAQFRTEVSAIEKFRYRRFFNGRDVMSAPRPSGVIDFFGLTEQQAKNGHRSAFQHVLDTVRPERQTNNRKIYRERWWIFAEPRSDWRDCSAGLTRYIATPMTAKHRLFVFLDEDVLPDQGLIPIGLDTAEHLAVLSSRIHNVFFEANAGSLGVFVGNIRYNNSVCFDPFPFPTLTDPQRTQLRALGEELDAHRKERQAE